MTKVDENPKWTQITLRDILFVTFWMGCFMGLVSTVATGGSPIWLLILPTVMFTGGMTVAVVSHLGFRPRFSVRTLAVFVTLVFAYFAAWEVTKRFGVPDMSPRHVKADITLYRAPLRAGSPTPFVVWKDEFEVTTGQDTRVGLLMRTGYKFWFFGLEFEMFKSSGEPLL